MILGLPLFGERQTTSVALAHGTAYEPNETALFIEVLKSKNIQMCELIQVPIVPLVELNCKTVSHV